MKLNNKASKRLKETDPNIKSSNKASKRPKYTLPGILALAGTGITLLAAIATTISRLVFNNPIDNPLIDIILITIGLLLSFTNSIRSIHSKANLQKKLLKYPRLSIVGIMLKRKQRANILTLSILFIALSSSLIHRHLTQTDTSPIIPLFFLALMTLASARTWLLEYRIRKGFYGTNEHEAREIIQFIVDNADNIDFTDNGRPKKIISERDLEELRQSVDNALRGLSPA